MSTDPPMVKSEGLGRPAPTTWLTAGTPGGSGAGPIVA